MPEWSLTEIDRVLVDQKWPPISDWWWNVIRRVDEARALGIRNYVLRGGRRGGKSSTIVGRIAIREVLSKAHCVPPGDTGYFAIISADKDQAQERIETCHAALKGLGIAHRKTANEITLTEPNHGGGFVGIKAFAATLSAVVSFTSIGFLCDEMARWRDKDGGAISAKAILTSLRATGATMPNAMNWYVSAPWSTLDEHHEMFERGDDGTQIVFHGATWDMNPTITERMTYALEPDEPSRLREYAAIPMSSDETKFFAAAFVDAACASVTDFNYHWVRTAAGGDFAFRRNSSAISVLSQMDQSSGPIGREPRPVFKVRFVDERLPGVRPLVPSVTITELCSEAQRLGADGVACDLHYIESVREHTEELEMELLEYPSDDTARYYIRARVLLSQGRLDLSEVAHTDAGKKLIKQLKECTGKPTKTDITIKNPTAEDGSHGDILSALVCGLWAIDQPGIPKGRNGMWSGSRRFSRDHDGGRDNGDTLRDLPPED